MNIELNEKMFEKLPDDEKNSEFIAMESKTFLRDVWDRYKKNKLAMIGLIFLVIMVVMAIFVPILSKYGFEDQNIALKKRHAKFRPSVWNRQTW